jgi:hypothetical protein
MYEQARHECAVRQLCKYRKEWGLAKFRVYISKSPNLHIYLNDFVDQYAKGNRGEIKCWKK